MYFKVKNTLKINLSRNKKKPNNFPMDSNTSKLKA